jgi:hypothetical protein
MILSFIGKKVLKMITEFEKAKTLESVIQKTFCQNCKAELKFESSKYFNSKGYIEYRISHVNGRIYSPDGKEAGKFSIQEKQISLELNGKYIYEAYKKLLNDPKTAQKLRADFGEDFANKLNSDKQGALKEIGMKIGYAIAHDILMDMKNDMEKNEIIKNEIIKNEIIKIVRREEGVFLSDAEIDEIPKDLNWFEKRIDIEQVSVEPAHYYGNYEYTVGVNVNYSLTPLEENNKQNQKIKNF